MLSLFNKNTFTDVSNKYLAEFNYKLLNVYLSNEKRDTWSLQDISMLCTCDNKYLFLNVNK